MKISSMKDRQSDCDECSECGHQHFDTLRSKYRTCPIDGCNCPMDPRETPKTLEELVDDMEPADEPDAYPPGRHEFVIQSHDRTHCLHCGLGEAEGNHVL